MHSSKLLAMLRDSGLTPEAARKRLERASAPVQRLPNLRLPDGGLFWYLDNQRDTDEYWRGLLAALEETNSAYGTALHALDAHGGLVPESQFSTISGSPSAKRGHLSIDKVRETLEDLRLLESFDDPLIGNCLRLASRASFQVEKISERRATLVAEKVFLEAFKEWTRKLGFVGFNAARIRGDEEAPRFGQYNWDYSAPSYIYPLRLLSKNKPDPGFVVADVVLREGLNLRQAGYFFRKCDSLRSTPGMYPFMAILVATWFEPDVLKRGRDAGILLATPRNLFGENIENALKEIVRTLSDAAIVATEESDRIESIFKSLSGFEGSMQQLRGPLFELIVGHCLHRSEEGSVDINRDVIAPVAGQRVNIDVLHTQGTQNVSAYECKGRLSEASISRDEVEDWITRQVPRILEYIRSRDELKNRNKISFAFWTTGRFAPDAVSYLKERKLSTRRYSVDWKDGQEVRRFATENGLSGVVRMLDDYYRSSRHRTRTILSGRRPLSTL